MRRRWAVALLGFGLVATALSVASTVLHRRYEHETGLKREFFTNSRFEGLPVSTEQAVEIDLSFLNDRSELPRRQFSVRWQGIWYLPQATSVDFFLGGDDRLRLFVDDTLVLERSLRLGLHTVSVTRVLEAGPHEIQLDYVKVWGGHYVNLQWASTGEAARPFPPSRLFPTRPTETQLARSQRLATLRHAVPVAWGLPLLAFLGFVVLPPVVRTARRTDTGRRRLTATVIFGLALTGYLLNALHFEPIIFDRQQNLIFSADTWTTVGSMRELTFRAQIRQHPLYSLIANSVVELVQLVSPIGLNRAILLTIALIAALNCTLAYLLFARVLGCTRTAVGFTAIYALAFANLAIFSIPETYALSTTGVLLYLVVASSLGPALDRRALLTLSGLAALAGLLNPPLLSLAIVHVVWIFTDRPMMSASRATAASLAGTAALFGLVNLAIFGPAFYLGYTVDNQQYGVLAHLTEIRSIALVICGFFLFSVVGPLQRLTHDLALGDAVGYLSSWTAGMAVCAYGAVVAAAGRGWSRFDRLTAAVIVWLVAVTLFYVYFNPDGMMLYSPQVVPAWLLLVARAHALPTAARWRTGALAVTAFLLFLHNVPAIYRTVQLP